MTSDLIEVFKLEKEFCSFFKVSIKKKRAELRTFKHVFPSLEQSRNARRQYLQDNKTTRVKK